MTYINDLTSLFGTVFLELFISVLWRTASFGERRKDLWETFQKFMQQVGLEFSYREGLQQFSMLRGHVARSLDF